MDSYGIWLPSSEQCCDILLYKSNQDQSGLCLSQSQRITDSDLVNEKSIADIKGTEFVVAIPPTEIKIHGSRLVCLLATASHVAFNKYTHEYRIEDINFDRVRSVQPRFSSFPIKDYSKKYSTVRMTSPSFHNDYLFPGDSALIGILDRSNDQQVELEPLKPALPNEIQRDAECCIIGHPIKPEDLKTCLPQGPYDENTGDLIRESFCHFAVL